MILMRGKFGQGIDRNTALRIVECSNWKDLEQMKVGMRYTTIEYNVS